MSNRERHARESGRVGAEEPPSLDEWVEAGRALRAIDPALYAITKMVAERAAAGPLVSVGVSDESYI